MAGKQLDTFDVDGTTLLSRTTTTYTATCPPTGVAGSPNNVGWGSWDGMLVSEVDHSNPMAVCDIQATQQDKFTVDGSPSAAVPHTTVTSAFDSFGRLTSETTTSDDGGGNGSPTTIVKKNAYVWNDGVTATATSATGPYLIDFPSFSDIEDTFGNRYQCTYTSYDGQDQSQGQSSHLTRGEATRIDRYTNCGSPVDNFTPSGQISEKNSLDVHGNQITSTDPDANAGNGAHLGCTVGGRSSPLARATTPPLPPCPRPRPTPSIRPRAPDTSRPPRPTHPAALGSGPSQPQTPTARRHRQATMPSAARSARRCPAKHRVSPPQRPRTPRGARVPTRRTRAWRSITASASTAPPR